VLHRNPVTRYGYGVAVSRASAYAREHDDPRCARGSYARPLRVLVPRACVEGRHLDRRLRRSLRVRALQRIGRSVKPKPKVAEYVECAKRLRNLADAFERGDVPLLFVYPGRPRAEARPSLESSTDQPIIFVQTPGEKRPSRPIDLAEARWALSELARMLDLAEKAIEPRALPSHPKPRDESD
jgi:hypothetical protein